MISKILIVEDDLVFCKLLSRFLSKNSFEVMDAQNGKDALALMNLNNFDQAILDYRLPDMTGIDILKKLKSKNPDTKILLITRFGDEEVAAEAKSAGADAFIAKPIDPDDLLKIIRKM